MALIEKITDTKKLKGDLVQRVSGLLERFDLVAMLSATIQSNKPDDQSAPSVQHKFNELVQGPITTLRELLKPLNDTANSTNNASLEIFQTIDRFLIQNSKILDDDILAFIFDERWDRLYNSEINKAGVQELLAQGNHSLVDSRISESGADIYIEQNAFNQKDKPGYQYQASDIRLIQNEIMSPYQGSFVIYNPIGNDTTGDKTLAELIASLDLDKPTLCVYNLGNYHWVAFAAIKTGDKITILYKDSKGTPNATLEGKVTVLLNNIDFIVNTQNEQSSGVECGIFALKNIKIMAEQLGHNPQAFINGFAEFQGFCSLQTAKTLRKDGYAKQYVIGKYHEITAEHDKLVKLKKLREMHDPEAQEIVQKLKEDDYFKNVSVIFLDATTDKSHTEQKAVITVEIASTQDTAPNNYTYNYRICLSEDLAVLADEIANNIARVLGGTVTPFNTVKEKGLVALVSPGEVSAIPKTIEQAITIATKSPELVLQELISNLDINDRVYHHQTVKAILAELFPNEPYYKAAAPSKDKQKPKKPNNTKEQEEAKKKYNKEKLEEDLGKLIEVESLIKQSIEAIDAHSLDKEVLVSYIMTIGETIHNISWKEDYSVCIRNKHGYRNRHKDKGNIKNPEGAKLDFETLAHLKDLARDQGFKGLLTENLDLVRDSLIHLQQKVHFILSKEQENLTELQSKDISCVLPSIQLEQKSHDVDEGFLRKAAAYYHDTTGLNNLINLIEKLNRVDHNRSLDLTDKMHRYYLGYLFCQVGEIAKEISDFIKPETSTNSAENNLTRFFFGKLGHYRQEIKNHPNIIYNVNNTQLLQMKLLLEQAIDKGLIGFLKLLQQKLLKPLILVNGEGNIDFDQTITQVNTKYGTINIPIQHQKYSEFENTNLKQLQELTIIVENGTENDLAGKVTRCQNQQAALEERIKIIQTELEEYQKLQHTLDPSNTTASPVVVDQQAAVNKLITQLLKASIAGEIRGLFKKLTSESVDYLKTQLMPQQVEILDLINKFVLLEDTKKDKKLDENVVVRDILRKIKKYETNIETAIKSFLNKFQSKGVDNYPVYTSIRTLCGNKGEDLNSKLFEQLSNLESSNLTKTSSTIQRQLEARKEEQKAIEHRITLTSKHFKEYGDTLHHAKHIGNQPIPDETIQPKEKTSEILSLLKKINHEISLLKSINSNSDQNKIEYITKMSFGFIGQYCKELSQSIENDSEMKEYVSHLLQECMSHTTYIRNKYIMHDSTANDQGLIAQNIHQVLLPCERDFEALATVSDSALQDNEEFLALSLAFFRLGRYDFALSLLQKCLDKVEDKGKLHDIDLQDYRGKDEAVDKVFEFAYQLLNTVSPSLDVQEVQKRNTEKAWYYHDKILVLNLMLNCHLAKQDFASALTTVNEVLQHTEYVQKRFEFTDFLASRLNIQLPTLPGKSEILFTFLNLKLHKSYILFILNRSEESYSILKAIEEDFNKGILDKNEFASVLARIYTDFAHNVKENDRKVEYLGKVKDLAEKCGDKLVVKFNILFREYENLLSARLDGGRNEQNELALKSKVLELKEHFERNKSKFIEEFGPEYYSYEMEVKLAELNVTIDTISRKQLLAELDGLYDKVNTIVIKNKFLISKLLEPSYSIEQIKPFILEFCENNKKAGTKHKIYENLYERIAKIYFQHGEFIKTQLCLEAVIKYCGNDLSFHQDETLGMLLKIIYYNQKDFQKSVKLHEYLAEKYLSQATLTQIPIFCILTNLIGSYSEAAKQAVNDSEAKYLNLIKLCYLSKYYKIHSSDMVRKEALPAMVKLQADNIDLYNKITAQAKIEIEKLCRDTPNYSLGEYRLPPHLASPVSSNTHTTQKTSTVTTEGKKDITNVFDPRELIEERLIEEIKKINPDNSTTEIKISMQGITKGDLVQYCKNQLKLTGNNLEFPGSNTCRIFLNQEAITILGNKLLAQNYTGNGTTNPEKTSCWNEYSKEGMKDILDLRLKSAGVDIDDVIVIHPNNVFNEETAEVFIKDLVAQVAAVGMGVDSGNATGQKLLIPTNLYGQHWVGMTIEFADGKFRVSYMDSEGNTMPESLNEGLVTELAKIYPNTGIEITEKVVEQQTSNNCGLHVIENLIAAVAGETARIGEENALAVHSALLEESLLEEAWRQSQATGEGILLKQSATKEPVLQQQTSIAQQPQAAPWYFGVGKVISSMVGKIAESMVDALRMAMYVDPYEVQGSIHFTLRAGVCAVPDRTTYSPELREALSQYKVANQNANKQLASPLPFSNLLNAIELTQGDVETWLQQFKQEATLLGE